MKRTGIILLLLFAGIPAAAAGTPPVDRCFTCHQGRHDRASTLFLNDVHRQMGITCAGCHGGSASAKDMDHAMDPDSGFIGVPDGDAISQACAKCHADSAVMRGYGASIPTNQWQFLQASAHGKLSTSANHRIAQCTTCHTAHGIRKVTDPASPVYPLNIPKTCGSCHADPAYMRTYNPSLPVDQLEKYHTSVHGTLNAKGDPKAAQCASCHGSHNIQPAGDGTSSVYAVNIPATCAKCHSDADYMKPYGIPTDQYDKYASSVHGIALLKRHDVGAPACNSCHGNHGAMPPGVASVSMVCGTCHALNAELFAASPHKKAFDEANLPECETCHNHHDIAQASDVLIGVGEGATCVQCHGETEKAYAVARSMRGAIDSLRAADSTAIALIDDAEQKGMEVSEQQFKLRDIHQAVLQTRTIIHAVNEQKFRTVITTGMTTASTVISEGREAIREYSFRRWGLGIATLIISIVAVSLYLTIRAIERKQALRKQNAGGR